MIHPIANREDATHYTLQGKAFEKEYEQKMLVLLCVFSTIEGLIQSSLVLSSWTRVTRRITKHVAIVPGTAFGESGEGHVRASYCYSTEHIKEALRRIAEFLDEIGYKK